MIAFPDQRRVFPDQFLGLKPGGVFVRIDPAGSSCFMTWLAINRKNAFCFSSSSRGL